MSATLTSMSPILKNQYIGPVREQLNNKIILLNRIEKDMESVVGKNFTIPLHTGRNEGIGAKAEGAALPTAGSQSYKETIVPMRYVYGRIKLTGQTIAAARKDEGAFLRAVDSEMKGLTKDLKTDMNRMIFGDGSGILATAGNTSNSTTVVVSSTAKLRVGMTVDILVTATGSTSTGILGATILTIPNATTFTIGTAVTTNNTFSVYRSGARNIEVMGLKGIVSNTNPASGSLQGLAVSTYPYWKASVLANSGTNRALTETLIQQAEDEIDINGDGNCSALFTSYGVRRAYQQLLQAQRIYQNTMKFDAGYSALEYNGKPLFVDKDCDANTMYLLDESHLKFYMLEDWSWMEDDKGSVLSKISGEDAYEAVMYGYVELGTSARNAMAKIEDISESSI